MYAVVLTISAAEDLEALQEPIHTRVIKLLERLSNWPDVSGAKPLSGKLTGKYRLRTGDYRLQFQVQGRTVVVEKIGHWDRFYEE